MYAERLSQESIELIYIMITLVLGDPTLKDSSLSQYDNIVILLGYVLIPYGRGKGKFPTNSYKLDV